MKLLLAETWRHFFYGEILFHRFTQAGIDVVAFKQCAYFDRSMPSRVQERYRLGPAIRRLNRDLLDAVAQHQADAVLLVRGDMVLPRTLRRIKAMGAVIAGCNNDDPFSATVPSHVWRHLRRGLRHYDLYFAYRHANLAQYRNAGCPRVELLRSFYIRELHKPLPPTGHPCDVSFIGHWEEDDRDDYIAALLGAHDIDFRLFGTHWDRSRHWRQIQAKFGAVRPVMGDDYNRAINGSRISLVLLSKRNNDTYTRRCFEIPAARTMMLAPHTDDLASLFEPDVEAVYFRTPQEMIDKARFYLMDDAARQRVAAAGHQRVLQDGHEAMDRVRFVMVQLAQAIAQKRRSQPLGATGVRG